MAGLAVLVTALAVLAARTTQELRAFRNVTASGEQGRPAPSVAPGSPTGYEGGRRSQVLQSTDGYHWVMQTQQMIASGTWRVRHVDYDNAPAGREVHWCTPLHLWLALVAWGDHAVTGRPWLIAVEHAALYAGPLLLALVLTVFVPWTARRFGAGAAAALAAGLVCIAPLAGEFGAGSFDHHGVAAAGAAGSVLLLVAGWREPERARRDFIAAGVVGAAGLWVNAATQIPVLVGIGLGAFLAHHVTSPERQKVDPSLWRVWGIAGGAASLLFYTLEYFPSHLGWRLEVNHPLYALAWMAAGDWLARLGGRASGQPWAKSAGDCAVAVAGFVALAAPLALVVLVPAKTFVVRDPFLWSLHVDYIREFAPLLSSWPGWEGLLVRINLLPLCALLGLALPLSGQTPAAVRAQLMLGIPAAVIATLLALAQQRWLHVSSALWLAIVVILLAVTADDSWRRWRRIFGAAFVIGVVLPFPIRSLVDAFAPMRGLSPENVRQFAVRDVAYWLQRRAGAQPAVVLSGPTATTELIYHGGFRGVGTLYWENLAGLRALVGIYGTSEPNRARELLRTHQVTHLVLFSWGPFIEESARLAHWLRPSAPVPKDTFAQTLLDATHPLPAWLRPMPYRLPESEAFKDQFALVLEVVTDQSPADAAVAQARFLAAVGKPAAARRLVEQVVSAQPDHLNAWVELARLQRAARDRAGHAASMRRVQALLANAPALEVRDRIPLALELAAAGARDVARTETQRCWASLNAGSLNHLWPEQLTILLRISQDLAVDIPADLRQAAEKLEAADRAATGQSGK